MVRRVRPECPDPDHLDPHENPRAHQNVDPNKVGDTVKFPQHDPNLAPQEPPTTLPPTRPRSSGARQPIPQRVPLTSPVPQRARPSVGVPARFPDQPPVVLFNPNDFTVRPPVAPQQPPNPNTNRFVPVAPQQFSNAQPAAANGPATQPPFIPFNFANPFNNGFTQFTQTQQVGLPGIPAIEPIVVTGRPAVQQQQQRQQPEIFQGDFASAPVLGPNDTPELNRFNGQTPNRFVPVAQPEIFQGDRPAAAPLGPNNPVLSPVVVATTTEQPQIVPIIEAERNQAAQVPTTNDFVPLPQPNERPAPTFAPIIVSTTAEPSQPSPITNVVPVVADTTTTATPETTTRRFKGRQRRPIETSSEEISENDNEESTDEVRASIRNKNLFNTENRKVPLNRFRGRQRIVKVVQKTENENGEVVLSEITGPGASQRPRGNRRPVAIRRRPIGRRRRPINEDQEEIIEEPFEEKKAFLVCSGGKCFRYVITIFCISFQVVKIISA